MILAGCVQCEIVGTNSIPQPQYYEAYKAQAVASRSYMEYYKAHYGRYPTMSYKTPHPTTVAIVREVYNKVAYHNGAVINAVYHADAGGHTQSAKEVWGGYLAYLQPVESPYDSVTSSYSISAESCKNKLASIGITVDGEPETWFDLSTATYTDGGFMRDISVCGQTLKLRTLREQVFGNANLKSTKITDIKVANGVLTFYTKGYGHGVGMSQRGALGCSAAGWNYIQIITHYYTGVTVGNI